MKSLMQCALGDDWDRLPASLRAHYQSAPNVDVGHMDIDFPVWMKPYLWLLHRLGALLPRSGSRIPTRVEKNVVGGLQYRASDKAYVERLASDYADDDDDYADDD